MKPISNAPKDIVARDGVHTHTLTTSSIGGDQGHTHSIEPTYVRVYAWQRTA